uniref:SFRICE_017195 n=1 Tax=Spodoptera frugiperda TaxID=7108 RepID=A0A2H1VYK7_SPOFR
MAVKNDAETLEKMKLLEERIKAPSIWGRVPCGIRFEDLQDRRYDDAIRLLKKHYLSEEITYRSVKIVDDKEGTDEFVHNVRIWMKDKMSIAAVKEGTDKLVGVLIMRIQEKTAFSRTFSRVKLTHNPLYSTVMKFYNEIEKPVCVFDRLGVKRYFKIYIVALKNRYRHRGIAKEMLKAATLLSASAGVAGICGIFTTARLHTVAQELGFTKLNEIYYVRYLIDGEIVFWDTGLGNYGAAIMALRIPNVEEVQELQTQHSSRFNIPIKMDDEETEEDKAQTPAPSDAADSTATKSEATPKK